YVVMRVLARGPGYIAVVRRDQAIVFSGAQVRAHKLRRKTLLVKSKVAVVIGISSFLRKSGIDPGCARCVREPRGQIGVDADRHDWRLAATVHDSRIRKGRTAEFTRKPWLRRHKPS